MAAVGWPEYAGTPAWPRVFATFPRGTHAWVRRETRAWVGGAVPGYVNGFLIAGIVAIIAIPAILPARPEF